MFKTWILKIPTNGFYFWRRAIFLTETETETWVC